ncbi:unnamed protein product [Urochloa humidicola]
MDPRGTSADGDNTAAGIAGDTAGASPTLPVEAVGGGANVKIAMANLENRMVLHGKETAEEPEENVEEFVFEEDVSVKATSKWLAIARFYSGRTIKSKIIFDELCNAWGKVDTRDLGENRFLIEFRSEKDLNFVLNGAPWKFKGDAMIVIPYDGFTRLSEVIIESLPLWIRIYDVPVAMQIPSFMSALGVKVGRVMEIGEAVKDFKRVRVEFALADALKPSVQIRVKGRGVMEFPVKYENVPHFCFVCGRIGHAERECPDEDLQGDGFRYGTELRTSPFKREMGRRLAVYTAAPSARRGLNFSGSQKERAASFSASSGPTRARGRDSREQSAGSGMKEDGRQRGDANMTTEELATGVERMVVDDTGVYQKDILHPDAGGDQRNIQMKDRVSGLESYAGSTDGSLSAIGKDEQDGGKVAVSMKERLQKAKRKLGSSAPGEQLIKSPRMARESEKEYLNRELKAGHATTVLEAMEDGAAHMVGVQMEGDKAGLLAREGILCEASKPMDPMATDNLVGAQEEPHQGQ